MTRGGVRKKTRSLPVFVIGAGVSGCAAALALAAKGVPVVLLNSGLDSVGLPGYGPDLVLSSSRPSPSDLPWGADPSDSAAIERAALALRDVWFAEAEAAAPGTLESLAPSAAATIIVDRRSVSLGTKWLLENDPLIDLRQAHVIAVENDVSGSVVVRTAFGEELPGRRAVIAVGLALGGRIAVGGQELHGGRYGEVAADDLLASLSQKGLQFARIQVSVGPRVQSLGGLEAHSGRGSNGRGTPGLPSDALTRVELAPVVGGLGARGVSDPHRMAVTCDPPSPYEKGAARTNAGAYALAEETPFDGSKRLEFGILPDGIVTGEWYVRPGFAVRSAEEHAGDGTSFGPISRPAHTITGNAVLGGQQPPAPEIWFAGQAAGAVGYAESMASGWRVGVSLGDSLASEGMRSE